MQKAPNTVIFGGTGFIGTHLSHALSSSGKSVLCTGSKTQLPADSFKEATTAFYLTHIGPSGGADAPESELKKIITENEAALIKSFELVKNSVQNFIFISTGGAIYGRTPPSACVETMPTHPVSVYGKVKKAQEALLAELGAKHDVAYTILRPSNIYGPGQKQNLIGTVIQNLSQGKSVKIFGHEGVVRDFLHINCFIDALMKVDHTAGEGKTYNIGSGIGTPTLSLVNELGRLMNVTPKIEFTPERTGDVPYSVLDSTLFRNRYSWKPKLNLIDGLKLLLK